MEIIGVRRSSVYSPNSEENDRLILEAVVNWLGGGRMISEEELSSEDSAGLYVSMARSEHALSLLSDFESHGKTVVNTAESVRNCGRSRLIELMRKNSLPLPPYNTGHGFWLKRGDSAAQSRSDVVFCPDSSSLERAKEEFAGRGITDYVVSAHVEGDLVKFYGCFGGYFRYFYPTDDGHSKFGDELRNGQAHHYHFDVDRLQNDISRLSAITGVDVYGGDCIVDSSGQYYIIDFNDWPSFSRCREEAAKQISRELAKRVSLQS